MWEKVGGRAVQGRGDAKMGVWPIGQGQFIRGQECWKDVPRGGGVQRRGEALSHSDPRFELPHKQASLEWVKTGLGEGKGEGQVQAD